MAKVQKVTNRAYITEYDALCDALERALTAACAGGDTVAAKDPVLKSLLETLHDLSARNTTAIKQSPVLSTLDEADAARDAATRDLFTLTNGYTASPFPEVKEAALAVCSVLDKYGRGMTAKGYAEQTALTESLLEDLGAEGTAAGIKALSGVAELTEALRAAQDKFNAAHDGYIKARLDKGESASSLKRPLMALINDGIVPYLNIVSEMDGYADLAGTVAENIKKTNDTVARRAAGKKAGEAEPL